MTANEKDTLCPQCGKPNCSCQSNWANSISESKIKRSGTVRTTWEVRTYDVWGNAREGFEVNDSFVVNRALELWIPVTVYNVGTPQEFRGGFPSDRQLRNVFGIGKTQIETDGDDLHIYLTRTRDGFPIGELLCISHDSLSPIRKKQEGK